LPFDPSLKGRSREAGFGRVQKLLPKMAELGRSFCRGQASFRYRRLFSASAVQYPQETSRGIVVTQDGSHLIIFPIGLSLGEWSATSRSRSAGPPIGVPEAEWPARVAIYLAAGPVAEEKWGNRGREVTILSQTTDAGTLLNSCGVPAPCACSLGKPRMPALHADPPALIQRDPALPFVELIEVALARQVGNTHEAANSGSSSDPFASEYCAEQKKAEDAAKTTTQ
jgi:hypothetical protein